MKHFYLFLLAATVLFTFSCKKDSGSGPATASHPPVTRSLNNAITSISASGEFVAAAIDTTLTVPAITITMPDGANLHTVILNFSLTANVSASINNSPVKSGDAIDLTQQLNFTVTSSDNSGRTTFKIISQTELQYFGVGGNILNQKSLNKTYDYYVDQFDGSTFQAINCGPTVSTMAIKWADSTFTRTPLDARNEILPGGGWWYTGNIQNYLSEHSINNSVDTLADLPGLIKQSINNGDAVILCLDMYSVPYNPLIYEHTQKFYTTLAAGWGHFILIKGYRETNTNFYLEAYDPYSGGLRYTALGGDQLFGRDRYYRADDIKRATDVWWPYAIVVAPKGQKVITSSRLKVNTIHKAIPEARGQ